MPPTLPTVEELYRAMGRMVVRVYGRTPGSSCVIASHAILGCSGLGSIFLNCGVVFGDGPEGDDPAEDRLREFVARIRERGVGGYVWLSERIQQRLEPLPHELGLEPLPSIPLMARAVRREAGGADAPAVAAPAGADAPAAAAPAAALTIRRVTTVEGLAEFLAVSEQTFDLPADLYGRVFTPSLLDDGSLSIYLGHEGAAPVACVCVVDDEGLAGISGMATVPKLQGRGIGADLLAHVLRAHGEHTQAFYLTASEAGKRLYRSQGFETVDAATAWVVPAPSA